MLTYSDWLDGDTVLLIDDIADDGSLLASSELSHASGMTSVRRREFAAGRNLARRAMSTLLGHPSASAILMGSAGEPLWPNGIRGSLSHTHCHSAVVVTRGPRHPSVGIDIDDGRLIGPAAAIELMTDDEIEGVIALGWTSDLEVARNIVFLAKEALFKYQFPLTRNRELDFDEVRLEPTEGGEVKAVSSIKDSTLLDALDSCRISFIEIHGLRLCLALGRRN